LRAPGDGGLQVPYHQRGTLHESVQFQGGNVRLAIESPYGRGDPNVAEFDILEFQALRIYDMGGGQEQTPRVKQESSGELLVPGLLACHDDASNRRCVVIDNVRESATPASGPRPMALDDLAERALLGGSQ